MKKIIALYLRISKRDESMVEDLESTSISNQRGMLREYVKMNMGGMGLEVREFVDDGFTGISMNRPALQELFRLMEKGMVYAIIVKDLSRFARNYIELGNYMEKIFPDMGVRFISVNDSYDSDKRKHGLPGIDTAFISIIHAYYCKELSEKLKTARRQHVRKGRCIFAKPPYGYWKSDSEKGKLVIDKETAPIVRHIFESYANGVSAYRITKDLNQSNVDTPNKRLERVGLIAFQEEYSKQLRWGCGVVLSILRNQVYIGDMIGNKEERVKISEKKLKRKDKEEWIIVEGTHEPIVDRELFFKVQGMLEEKKPVQRKPIDIKEKAGNHCFKGKLICSICYGIMTKHGGHKGIAYYSCARCRLAGRKVVTVHSDFLEMKIMGGWKQHKMPEIPKQSCELSLAKSRTKEESEAITKPTEQMKGGKKADRKAEAELLLSYEKYAEGLITREEYEERRMMLQEIRQSNIREVQPADIPVEKVSEQEEHTSILGNDGRLSGKAVDWYIDRIVVYSASDIQIKWRNEGKEAK